MEQMRTIGMLPPEQGRTSDAAGLLQAGPVFQIAGGRLEPVSGTRLGFPQETIAAMPVAFPQARCHFISYKVIAQSIAAIVNQIPQGKPAQQPLLQLLSGIYYQNSAPQSQYDEARRAISDLSALPITRSTGITQQCCQYATELLCALNGAVGNLRPGNGSWNASIGYQYDPEKWFYALSPVQYYDNNLVLYTLTGGLTLTPNTFYLYDTDRQRLSSIADLAQDLPPVGVFSAYWKTQKRPFLYSSNNSFSMPASRECAGNSYTVNFTSYYLG